MPQPHIHKNISNSIRRVIHDTRNLSDNPTYGISKRLLASALAIVAGSAVAVGCASAEGSVEFSLTVPDTPVLEVVIQGTDAEGDINLSMAPTMAKADFNTADVAVTVGTSSTAGYNLKMAVGNSGQLVSGGNSIPSLAAAEDENGDPYSCTKATKLTCNFTVNSWGYWMTGDTANNYKPIPSAETQLANYTTGATNGVTTELEFGVRVNAKQAGGDYQTTINFIATANPELMDDISKVKTMQKFATLTSEEKETVLSSMTAGQSYQLTDSRDGTVYNVGKLNGKIWMLDNLALGGSSAMILDSTNTNLADNTTFILPASGTVCFYNSNCTGTDGTTTGNGGTVAAINADYKTTTSANNTDFTYNSNGDVSKAGVYYNYCAASAGTICDASNSNDAQYDICPRGWRLPTGGPDANTSEFRALANNLGNVTSGNLTGDAYTNFKAAFHAGLSGYFYNGSPSNQGNYGNFWSSTRSGDYSMYRVYLYTSTINPEDNSSRYYGYSVRCVLKGASTSITFNGNGADSGETTTLSFEAGSATLPNADVAGFEKTGRYGFTTWNTKTDGSGTSYAAGTTITAEMNGLTLYAQWQEVTIAMQDANSTSLGNLLTNNGDTAYLYDNRDDNVYTIGKLNDKYWMLDNLRLGGSSAMTLTGENTNLATASTTYILPASGTVCFSSSNCTGTDGTTTGTGHTVAAINIDSKTKTQSYGSGSNKIGTYYNYCAASAGTICDAEGSNNNNNAQYDICPKGWRLPTGGSNADTSEFRALANNLGNVTSGDLKGDAYTSFKAAFHAGLSGTFSDGSVRNQTSWVAFWSSTRTDGVIKYMRSLYLSTTTVGPQNSSNRYDGYSVRCVYGG